MLTKALSKVFMLVTSFAELEEKLHEFVNDETDKFYNHSATFAMDCVKNGSVSQEDLISHWSSKFREVLATF